MSDMLPLTCRGNNKRPTKTDGMRNLAAAEFGRRDELEVGLSHRGRP